MKFIIVDKLDSNLIKMFYKNIVLKEKKMYKGYVLVLEEFNLLVK